MGHCGGSPGSLFQPPQTIGQQRSVLCVEGVPAVQTRDRLRIASITTRPVNGQEKNGLDEAMNDLKAATPDAAIRSSSSDGWAGSPITPP